MKNKTLFILSASLLVVVLIFVAGAVLQRAMPISAVAGEGSSLRTVSVNGTGQVLVEPDVAYINIGVRTQLDDVKEALSMNNLQAQQLIDVLKAMGIADADIKTSNFNVYQTEDWNLPTNEDGSTYKLFVVENTVNVTVRNLDNLGEILSTSIENGANNIWGITFDKEDKSGAIELAREGAVESARSQAETLSRLAGVSLGEVQTIGSYSYQPVVYAMDRAVSAEMAAGSVPIQSGQLTVSVEVTLTYIIQ